MQQAVPPAAGGPIPKIVVIDDDPTGSQTVHSCPLLLRWDHDTLLEGLRHPSPLLFLLANTRALSPGAARERVQEICRGLRPALLEAERRGWIRGWQLVSRGDSTLRGHYPLEVDTLASELGPFDATLLAPAFLEGGRSTVEGIHLLHGRPVHDSPFARDGLFGYRHSDLRAWVEEKSGGRIPAAAVRHLSLRDLEGPPEALRARLTSLRENTTVAVDAARPEHLAALAVALRELCFSPSALAGSSPRRDAAGAAAAQEPPPPWPTPGDPRVPPAGQETELPDSLPEAATLSSQHPLKRPVDPLRVPPPPAPCPSASALPPEASGLRPAPPHPLTPPRFLIQSAAGLVGALADLPPQPLDAGGLAALRLGGPDAPKPGLVLVGSHVPLADQQLARLLADRRCLGVEVRVPTVLRALEGPLPDRLLPSLEAGWLTQLRQALDRGCTPVLFTSRGEVTCARAATRRALGLAVAELMARLAAALAPDLGYVISKGGITTHTLLADGLGVTAVQLQGQLLPGLSLVLAGPDALPVLTFPGNLGEADTLWQAWRRMEEAGPCGELTP